MTGMLWFNTLPGEVAGTLAQPSWPRAPPGLGLQPGGVESKGREVHGAEPA